MWILIISMYLAQPLGQTQSKGVIQAPQRDYETCARERDRIRATWYTDGYRISPRCVYVKHYNQQDYSF